MTAPASPPARAARSEWSLKAILLFALVLSFLTIVGLAGWLHRPAPPAGLPDDPAVAAARAMLGDRLTVRAGDLRFASAFDDAEAETVPGAESDSARLARLQSAAGWLEEGRARHRFDPRFSCLLGHLELAAARPRRAERHYRLAVLLAPRYGEARLGLGVALAGRAATEDDERAARAHTLAAIAQLAAVEESDPFHLPALFDRVILLAEVGRMDEARRLAERYAELEPASVWNSILLRRVAR
jgi:tetratricopeptide (TPR) repeat protein